LSFPKKSQLFALSTYFQKITHIDALFSSCVLCGVHCRTCDETRRSLCDACFVELPFITSNSCHVCALPVAMPSPLCGRCLICRPAYKKCIATFNYWQPVTYLIQSLKFHDKLAYASLLGTIMADTLETRLDQLPDVIIPVPLHGTRLRERGYNQALELARPIAKKLLVSIDVLSCCRSRSTSVQSLLSAKDRHKNVAGAFEFSNIEKYKRVAIVDDVMTTGHTINELTSTLLRAGVEEVLVWVCARAPLH